MRNGANLALLSLTVAFSQTSNPFKPNAQIGKPILIGEDPDDYGKIKVDYGHLHELTIESVEVAWHFPNRHLNVIAGVNQKLLIFRGSVRNPSKESQSHLSSGALFRTRIWRRYSGPGQFRFVLGYDPETLKPIDLTIPPGATGKFIMVLEVPAGYNDLQFGLYYRTPKRIAWYDLASASAALRSVFAGPDGSVLQTAKVPAGSAFDLDGLEMRITGTGQPATIAGSRLTGNGLVVDISVTNRMLLPSRCGWQYFAAEVTTADGTAVKFYPDLIDKATDRSWSGDLPGGASMTGRYIFNSNAVIKPRALRLTSAATGRVVEAALGN